MQSSICKYCLLYDNPEDLIKPCECSNPVHKECLKRWYVLKKSESCEICHERFEVQYKYVIFIKSYISPDAKFSLCISFIMFILLTVFFFCFIFLLTGTTLKRGNGVIYALGLIMIAIALSVFLMGVMDIFKIVKTIK